MTGVLNITVEINFGQHVLRYDMQTSKKESYLLIIQLQLMAPRQITGQNYFDNTDFLYYSLLWLSAEAIIK